MVRHTGERDAGREALLGEGYRWGDILGREVLVGRHNWERGTGGETYWGERCWW